MRSACCSTTSMSASFLCEFVWGGGRDQVGLLLNITSLFQCMERMQEGKKVMERSVQWESGHRKQHAVGMNRLWT